MDAQLARLGARLAARRGETTAIDELSNAAIARFRELGTPFWLAVTLLEHAEWLAGEGRVEQAQAGLLEAREIFERLKCGPWLERLDRVSSQAVVVA